MISRSFILLLLANIITCFNDAGSSLNEDYDIQIGSPCYDFSKPDRILTLPVILHEISGITEVDSTSVACIQDELGFIFIYDIEKNEIIRQFPFGSVGDYEGIARAGNDLYVIRSDELLIHVQDFRSARPKSMTYIADIPGRNIESLCYDRINARLLMMPKDIPDNNNETRDKLLIYAFDLETKKLIKGPAYSFDKHMIRRFALEHEINIPVMKQKGGVKEPDIKFRISAIAVHPVTGRLFLISGAEKLLFILNVNRGIENMISLDPELFTQPEGITFLRNGDMLISSEGGNRKPAIVRYNYSRP